MSFYLDANIVVALLTPEPFSTRVDSFLRAHPDVLIVSDFGAAEYVSAISRRVRMGDIAPGNGQTALTILDSWLSRSASRIEIRPTDVALADSFLRRLDLTLLTPDAIHIAVTQRLGATLLTSDRRMAVGARAIGIPVVTP